jgi:maltooligosyltrehalose trehalohydrolase
MPAPDVNERTERQGPWSFADARPLGAFPSGGSTRFALFSTTAQRCEVRLFDHDQRVLRGEPLAPTGDGYYEAVLSGIGPGALYKFVLDGRELPDPYARFLPFGVHGPAEVVQSTYTWRHGQGCPRPLREHVLYELHVGTFTEAGTFEAVRERLRHLAALGVTALELMPVSAFPGACGWGYDGVAHYAPFAGYGRPDQLRALVDEAHGYGLAVFLDAVYNHFGPSGNYLTAYSPLYFRHDVRNAWGDAPNFAHPIVRRYIIDNARYWLNEFRFDGLRLDATHAIIDPSAWHILRELAQEVARLEPHKLLIAEDERNNPGLVEELGLDAIWADDFHHEVRVTLTGEQDGYYRAYRGGPRAIAETIRGGWCYCGQTYAPTGHPRGQAAPRLPAEAFVYCIQNHDQVGNRACGDRLNHVIPEEAYGAVSALLLFLPMTPLLFMGQEWAASTPFQYFTDHEAELGVLVSEGRRAEFKGFAAFSDAASCDAIPDPQSPRTFLGSKLRWQELDEPEHRRVLELYRRLLHLRRTDPVMRSSGRATLEVEDHDQLLTVRRWSAAGDRVLLVNLSPQPTAPARVSSFLPDRPVLLRTGAGEGLALAPYEAVVFGGLDGNGAAA